MENARSKEIINEMIDHLAVTIGAENVVGWLLDTGVKPEELANDFYFLQSDIDAELAKRKEKNNG